MTRPVEEEASGHAAWWRRPMVLLSVLGLLCLSLYNLVERSLWIDEAFSMDTATRSWGGVIQQAIHFENQSPLYYLVLHAWLPLSSLPWWGRVLSLCLVLSAIPLIAVAARTSTPRAVVPGILLFCLSPAVVRAACDMRSYALLLLAVAGMYAAFARIWLDPRPPQRWHWVAWGACGYLAMLTLYYAGFAFAGTVVAGFVLGRYRRELLATTAVVALALVPWLQVIASQVPRQPLPPTLPQQSLPEDLVRSVAAALIPTPVSERPAFVAFVIAVLVCAAVIIARSDRGMPSSPATIWALVGTIAFAGPWLIKVANVADVAGRHWLPVPIAGILAVATASANVAPRWLGLTLLGSVIAGSVAGLASFERNHSPTDWRRLAASVEARRTANQPLLFVPSRGALIYSRYQRHPGATHGLPADVILNHYPLDPQMMIHDAPSLQARLRALLPSTPASFWLVREEYAPSFGGALVDEYRDANCTVLAVEEAQGLKAEHLQCSMAGAH